CFRLANTGAVHGNHYVGRHAYHGRGSVDVYDRGGLDASANHHSRARTPRRMAKGFKGDDVMVWSDTGSFFAMGGYAFYVWGSMGMTALALCTECFVLSRRRQAAIRL